MSFTKPTNAALAVMAAALAATAASAATPGRHAGRPPGRKIDRLDRHGPEEGHGLRQARRRREPDRLRRAPGRRQALRRHARRRHRHRRRQDRQMGQEEPAHRSLPKDATFSVDFNPVADRMRILSSTGMSLRINVEDGKATVDGSLKYAEADANKGKQPKVTAGAYSQQLSPAPRRRRSTTSTPPTAPSCARLRPTTAFSTPSASSAPRSTATSRSTSGRTARAATPAGCSRAARSTRSTSRPA